MYTTSQLVSLINSYISNLNYKRNPEELYKPIEYTLSLGGKRIRPLSLLMAYNLFKDDVDAALPQAAGIEMYHNYTLLHDDLMDRSEMRRGKPTAYTIWGDNAAILSGDTMQVLAYQYMSQCNTNLKEVINLFTTTAIEVCEGQQMDMSFENRSDVTESEYLEMIRLKTAVLLAASLKIGGVLADASINDVNALYSFGEKIGLAFQLQDDLLDVYGDPAVFGKNNGVDIVCNKKTYLLIKALELANPQQKATLEKWISATQFDSEKKIAEVTSIYSELNLKELSEKKIQCYFNDAMNCLASIQVASDRKDELKSLIAKLMNRNI